MPTDETHGYLAVLWSGAAYVEKVVELPDSRTRGKTLTRTEYAKRLAGYPLALPRITSPWAGSEIHA